MATLLDRILTPRLTNSMNMKKTSNFEKSDQDLDYYPERFLERVNVIYDLTDEPLRFDFRRKWSKFIKYVVLFE